MFGKNNTSTGLNAYSVRDSKSESYSAPFYAVNHATAQRSLEDAVNQQENQIAKFPSDFDLYHVGHFDDKTGKFEGLKSPEHIIHALQLKPKLTN